MNFLRPNLTMNYLRSTIVPVRYINKYDNNIYCEYLPKSYQYPVLENKKVRQVAVYFVCLLCFIRL